jgi:hypothetical protein
MSMISFRAFVRGGTVVAVLLAGAGSLSAEQLLSFTKIEGDTFLVGFDSADPDFVNHEVEVVGLAPGQSLVGIDIRPATGGLYGVGVGALSANLYLIDIETGLAVSIGAPLSPKPVGAGFGFDFNPAIDRVRLVSDLDQNLVLNPDTGAVTVATNLFYPNSDVNFGRNPKVVHIAYDNNVAGTMTTQQRGIDVQQMVLVTVANNAGTLGTIGRFGLRPTEIGGFDVSGDTNVGYALLTVQGSEVQVLTRINLATGGAAPLGLTPIDLDLNGLTVVPVVEE